MTSPALGAPGAVPPEARGVFDAAPMGLALYHPATGALIDLNERYAQILGRSRAELPGTTWQSLTHPDDLAQDLKTADALERGETELFERIKRYRRPDGSWVWVRVQVRRAPGPCGGDIVNWVWAEPLGPGVRAHETLLTPRLTDESGWHEAAERLHRVESAAHVGFWDWDLKTGELVWSDGCYRLFGLAARQAPPSVELMCSVVHPEDRARVGRAIETSAHRGASLVLRFRVVLPDGAVRWIDGYGAASDEGSDAPRYLSGVFIDASESVTLARDNAQLTRLAHDRAVSEERLRQAAEAADFGVFECDFVSRRAHWSPQAVRILGCEANDRPWGGDLLPCVHVEDVDRVRRVFAHALDPAGQGLLQAEHRVIRGDGSLRWVRLRGRTHFEAGQAVRLYGLVLDQTERRVAEAQLVEHSQRLSAANSAKSAFLANMSHEIRTPLGVISGLAELLRRDATDVRQRRRLAQLFHTSEHVLGVVNDILDLSKIEAGEQALEPEIFRLGSVLDRVRRLFVDHAREKGLTLGSDVPPALRALVLRGDSLRLSQVLINLCGNAIKFTREGSVVISIEAMQIDAEGARLRFAVSDTGPGIDPALRSHLFEPFVQGDASTSRRFGGTGLGLAICHRLVALMGGTLDLSSEPGQGSKFFFELWLPQADAAAGEADAPDEAGGSVDLSDRRILLAEDHPLSQEILYEMLEPLGCEVMLASDGLEAVQLARAGRYDLILMDMQMPGVDGLEATRRIRELRAHRDTPIIALTANVFLEDRARCLDAGMNDHLSKPITQAALARALARWLRVPTPGVAPAQPVLPVDSALLEALIALPGIQVDGAWRSSTEQLRSFRELLQRFAQGQLDEVKRILGLLQAGRGGAARDAAHALAGAAGMVGARAVMNTARAIERSLAIGRPELEALPLARDCLGELQQLCAAIDGLEPLVGTPAPGAAAAAPKAAA